MTTDGAITAEGLEALKAELAELEGPARVELAGKIALAPFVTHTMGLAKINEAFELMHEGKSIRSVVNYAE